MYENIYYVTPNAPFPRRERREGDPATANKLPVYTHTMTGQCVHSV